MRKCWYDIESWMTPIQNSRKICMTTVTKISGTTIYLLWWLIRWKKGIKTESTWFVSRTFSNISDEVMDVRHMTYPDNFFDIAIDKSTIDALLCGNNAFLNVAIMLKVSNLNWIGRMSKECWSLEVNTSQYHTEDQKADLSTLIDLTLHGAWNSTSCIHQMLSQKNRKKRKRTTFIFAQNRTTGRKHRTSSGQRWRPNY